MIFNQPIHDNENDYTPMSQPRTNGIHAKIPRSPSTGPFVGLPTASELSVNSVGGVRRKTSEKHPRCFNKGPPLPGGGDVTVMGKGER